MVQAKGVGIEDPFEAHPVLEAALKLALQTAPWNTGKQLVGSRDDALMIADEAVESVGLGRGDSPVKALKGLLDKLVRCAWVKADVQTHTKRRLVDGGMDAGAAEALSGRIATNVVASARSSSASIAWTARDEDCPLDDLLRLVFRRAWPLVGLSSRARRAAEQLLTSAAMGRFARELLHSDVMSGGSGQTAVAAAIAKHLTTIGDFDALLVAEDLDELVAAFLVNRIPAIRRKLVPGFLNQDSRAMEARFAQIAVQLPALLHVVSQRATASVEASPPEPAAAGSTAIQTADLPVFPPLFVPLQEELAELEQLGPALIERARIRPEDVRDLLQDARVGLFMSRDVDGRVRQGSWHGELQNQIRIIRRHGRPDQPLDDGTYEDQSQRRVGSEPDARAEPPPEVEAILAQQRSYYENLRAQSHTVVLIRAILADPSLLFDESSPFQVYRRRVALWVYQEVERRGWDDNRDTLVTEILASLKASFGPLHYPETDPSERS